MHRFFLKIFLSTLFLSLTIQAQTVNSNILLKELLDLPAPPNEDGKERKVKERTEDFYSDENVPPDDAPIEDLLDYWAKQNESYNRLNYQLKPSAKTIERIIEACENDPKKLVNYLSVLPSDARTSDTVKRFYDNLQQENEMEPYTQLRLKEWLKHNSNHFVAELVREAQKTKDQNDYVPNNQQDVLLALAKIDWNSARPIVERLENDSSQPYSQTLARWVRYKRAIDTEDESAAEKYRRMLQDIVENKTAAWAQRDLAMDALAASGDWKGRDEWYLSLLADETLLTIQDNGNTGLTTLISMSPPKKWIEKMIELVKSDNFAVRSAAARNLMDSFDGKNKEVLQALLPWLSDPNWAKPSRNSERGQLISALAEVDLPESIPSLIAIVMNEEEFRFAAISALVRYKDSRAVPALKFALSKEMNPETRGVIVQALIASGGLSDDEQMAALEAYATMISTPEGLAELNAFQYGYYGDSHEEEEPEEKAETKTLPLQISIGKTVGEQEEPSDGLVVRAVERLKVLRRTKPPVAAALAEIMQKWKGAAIFAEILRQIRIGEADIETILSALAKRKDFREKVPNELAMLRSSSGTTRGIGACLIEEESEYAGILRGTDAEARIAMLGCARLLRAKLPVAEVAEFTNDSNKLLALAAERWLESEDSPQARALVLARHPNEALILGARMAFVPEEKAIERKNLDALFESVNGIGYWSISFSNLKKNEEKLRSEIKAVPELTAVYATLPDAASGQQIIRVYKDKIVYTYEEDVARYWERILTAKEFENFYNFLLANKIDALPSFNNSSCEECQSSEFVMFGRSGGRRVFLRSTYNEKNVVKELFDYFESFKNENLALKYRFSDKVKGLEVLLADKNLEARAVWKKDADLRLLIEDKLKQKDIEKELLELQKSLYNIEIDEENSDQRQAQYAAFMKKRQEMAGAHLSWRNLQNGKLSASAAQPSEFSLFNRNAENFQSVINYSTPEWQVRAGNVEIRVAEPYEGGLYKINGSSNPVKFKEGLYANPIITADGKWAVATKAETDWSEPKTVVRINLQTGREYKINVLPSDAFYPIAFIGSHNKVLLYRAKGHFLRTSGAPIEAAQEISPEESWALRRRGKIKPNPSPKTPEYYLFDANTEAVQLIKGEFRPLWQQSVRRLQPTENPGEFWAAIYEKKTNETNIGRYDEKTFRFQPLIKIPDINLSGMDIWVDEKEAKIYFVYLGHLLALPLAAR